HANDCLFSGAGSFGSIYKTRTNFHPAARIIVKLKFHEAASIRLLESIFCQRKFKPCLRSELTNDQNSQNAAIEILVRIVEPKFHTGTHCFVLLEHSGPDTVFHNRWSCGCLGIGKAERG